MIRRRKSGLQALRATKRTIGYFVLITVAFTMLLPFLWMVSTSLKTEDEAFRWPPTFIPNDVQWHNYIRVFQVGPFGQYFLNSLIVAAGIVLGQLFICSLAAYGFARLRFIGRDVIFMLYLATMMVPFQVTLIPLYLLVVKFGWLDSYLGLIIPGISSAFGIFLLRQAFLSIPNELQDAARIDGCSDFGIYWRIFLPLNLPSLTTLGVFSFLGAWTDLLWPLLIVQSRMMRTLELGLTVFKTENPSWYRVNWPLMMAASIIVIAPVLLIYAFCQRYVIKGIALTGLKS